jgi:hypothetical protein
VKDMADPKDDIELNEDIKSIDTIKTQHRTGRLEIDTIFPCFG